MYKSGRLAGLEPVRCQLLRRQTAHVSPHSQLQGQSGNRASFTQLRRQSELARLCVQSAHPFSHHIEPCTRGHAATRGRHRHKHARSQRKNGVTLSRHASQMAPQRRKQQGIAQTQIRSHHGIR